MERTTRMSKVFSAHAVSVDGYITGRDPGPGRGLGDGGTLFDWYGAGDTPSQVFDGFMLSEASAPVFDALAGRVGAVVAGRNTLPAHVRLRLVEAVPAAGMTHLCYEVAR
jgi:hypothetical protein